MFWRAVAVWTGLGAVIVFLLAAAGAAVYGGYLPTFPLSAEQWGALAAVAFVGTLAAYAAGTNRRSASSSVYE